MRNPLPTLFLALILSTFVESSEASREEYLQLLDSHPNFMKFPGSSAQGEIEILLDPDKMAEVEKKTGVEVGIIHRSKWGWLWLNEACQFPNGHQAVFGRIVMARSLDSTAGVAVMPMTTEGKIILVCNYRHATRSWEIELSRGFIDRNEEPWQAAQREALEETGMLVDDLVFLGKMPPDSGLTSNVVPIFLAKVRSKEQMQLEEEEVIAEVPALSIAEVKQAFLQGSLECTIQGVKKKVPFRDPFLAYALLMYEIRQSSS